MSSHRASFNINGVLWMLLWAVTFNTSMSLTKLLSVDISSFMIVFVRLGFGFLFICPFFFQEGFRILRTDHLPLHLLRMVFACTSMVCTYYAYSNLPLAFATSIGFSEPIIISLLAVFTLGDRLSLTQWFLICLGYGGVLIMIKPTGGSWDSAVFVALAANIFASCAMISVKKLSRTESTSKILIYFHVLGLLFLGILSVFFWKTPHFHDLFILLFIGITATISQLCIVKAMQNGDPSALSPFEYSRLVIAIPVGMLFFDEIPTVWSIFGSLIIVMSNFFMTLYESKRKETLQT